MGVSNGVRTGSVVAVARRIGGPVVAAVLLCLLIGCQGSRPIQSHRLIEHQALIDFSGLKPSETYPDVKMNGAIPAGWESLPVQKSALYVHSQWRSPSTRTGVGAAHINLPLPLSAKMVMWLARQEYTKRAKDGKLIKEWTDELGRDWFEAENDKYHMCGYALAQGFDAWIVYFGYKLNAPPDFGEISQASRSADTFFPLVGGSPATKPTTEPTTSATTDPSASTTEPNPAGK